jgi:hypothetical protein
LDEKHAASFSLARHQMHMAGVMHNDLRRENVMFISSSFTSSTKDDVVICKIIDYGMSEFIVPPWLHKPLEHMSWPPSSVNYEYDDEQEEGEKNEQNDFELMPDVGLLQTSSYSVNTNNNTSTSSISNGDLSTRFSASSECNDE